MFWQYCTYHGKCLFVCEHVCFVSTVLTMVNVYLCVSMCVCQYCTYHGKCLFVCEHVCFVSTALTMVNVYLCVSMCVLAVLYLPW